MKTIKTFKEDFNILLEMLKNNEPFSFIRFSDGEMFCLQNRKLELSERGTFIDDRLAGPTYTKEDYKFFDPEQHQVFHKKLWDSFIYESDNYYVGISCLCCVGLQNFKWMKTALEDNQSDHNLKKYNITWANLFVNSNYPRFISEFLPELKTKKIVLICNENAVISGSELNVVKDFRIGRNAMITNIDIHLDISKWIEENQIEDHVFCFSASSLTNITIYELSKKYPKNTYLDIGTTLNRQFGFPLTRDYLRAYWSDRDHPDLHKTCVWI